MAKETGTNGSNEQEAPEMSAKERRALFDAAIAAQTVIDEARAGVERAEQASYAAIGAIFDQCGTGPWEYKGRRFNVGKKNDKYFFKKLPNQDIVKIA